MSLVRIRDEMTGIEFRVGIVHVPEAPQADKWRLHIAKSDDEGRVYWLPSHDEATKAASDIVGEAVHLILNRDEQMTRRNHVR